MSDQVEASIQELEARELLSASVVLSNNTLTVRADNSGPHSIAIRQARGDILALTVDGAPEQDFNVSDVNAVIIFGGSGGNNYIAVSQRLREYTTRTDFIAGPGNDTLIGGDGRSELIAGVGNCLLEGGNADNTLIGGPGRDTLIGGPAYDLIIAGRGHTLIEGNGGQNMIFGGQRGDTIIGGDFRDQIFGSPSADLIQLGSGSETVWSDGGADTITGGGSGTVIHRSTFPDLSKVREQVLPDIPT